jgi:hypothetical protein
MPKPDRLKLLCFLPDLDGGGAERTIVNLVNAFVAAGPPDQRPSTSFPPRPQQQ